LRKRMVMESITALGTVSRKALWKGRVAAALVILFTLFDSFAKSMRVEPVVKASAQRGFFSGLIPVIGCMLLVCVIAEVIPSASIPGAILIPGYLGGAVATNPRIGTPLLSKALSPVCVGVLGWKDLDLEKPSSSCHHSSEKNGSFRLTGSQRAVTRLCGVIS